MCESEDLIKSKQRVSEFGEVFTPANIVSDMLDLVKDESYRVESKVLEPACGNGNFLVQILQRKLDTVSKTASPVDYYKQVLTAVSNVYGVDIQLDNIVHARARLLEIINATVVKDGYPEYVIDTEFKDSKDPMIYILEHNIIWGDTLKNEMYTVKKSRRKNKVTEVSNNANKEIQLLVYCDWVVTNEEISYKECAPEDTENVLSEYNAVPYDELYRTNQDKHDMAEIQG